MTITAGAATSIGRVRAVNEDAWCITPGLWAVADGMGGHRAGDRASQLAVGALTELGQQGSLTTEQLQAALAGANAAMLRESGTSPGERAMGTTVCGVAEVSLGGARHWAVFNIGDSRVYQVVAGGLEQLTVDHSEVQELLSAGRITAREARAHPLRNVVTRSLGSSPAPEADVWLIPIEPDQTFVLCSDGLTLELDDDQIAAVLRTGGAAPADIAQELVSLADAAGGRDNITVVVVRTDVPEGHPDVELTNPHGRALLADDDEAGTDRG
ncbi:MAG: protein phosphatase 2C domain-containing protein [Marmoricola sp.]